MKRVLVTPNYVDFPAAHYAFYYTNELPIDINDYIGMILPIDFNDTQASYETSHPNISSNDFTCYISYLPSSTLYIYIFIIFNNN